MSPEARCPKCGAPVNHEVAAGFCTACLLEEGLSPNELTQNSITLRYFGDYELIEEIARGGMGVVYKARQRSLDRIVAVKMILSGHLASEAQAQRFRAEARAAAALQHPGIVAIHEVGEHDGLLFFSMDYVVGQSLAQLVRDGPWSAVRAAQCVRDIAEAIQYAHEQGVLHRDLKPSNVLMDANGKPRVTDFGLAKQLNADHQPPTNDPHLTLSGQVLGSPSFMPPEQASSQHRDLAPASDVYSLGAILYHCLTGRPPFVAETLAQTLRMVAEQEPVPPRLLNASVPRDLETICLKCLEKDPQRRYPTANDLAEDLQHFLNHEPIQARPVNAAGRLWRWFKRNPGLARTAAAALLLFFAVTIGGPIALIQINNARKHAEARQREATLEAARSQQFAQFMKAMLRSAGPSVARGRDATLLRELLEKTAVRVETELRHQPEIQGDMYATLGSTYRDMGDYQQAIPMLERAVAKYREAFRGDHKKLALALGYLGQYQSFNTDVAGGKRSAQAGLEMARRCGDAETLANCLLNVARSFEGWGMTSTEGLAYAREAADLLKKLTNNPTALADCYGFMAGATLDGDRAEAEQLARAALEINSRNLEPDHPSVVGDIFMLGQIQLDRGKFAEAEVNLRETLRLHRKIYDSTHPHHFIVLRLLGEALTKQGKQSELEAAYREALELDGHAPYALEAADKLASIWRVQGKRAEADQLVKDYTARWRQSRKTNDLVYADLLNTLANRAAEEKKFDEGAKLSREALEIQLKLASNSLPKLITTLGSMAAMLDNAGKYSEAEPLLQQRLELQQRLHGSNDLQIAESLSWMGWVFHKDRKYAEVEHLLERRLAIQKLHFGSVHTNLIGTLDRQMSNFEELRKWSEAEAATQQLLAIRKAAFGEDDPKTIATLAKLGSLLVKQGKPAELDVLGQRLVAVAQKNGSNNFPAVIKTLASLCKEFQGAREYALAESFLEHRLALQRMLYGDTNASVLDSLGWMAEIRSWAGKMAEAEQVLQEKIDIQARMFGRESTNVNDTVEWLANIYEDDRKWVEAETLRKESLATRQKIYGKGHPRTERAATRLVSIYIKQGKTAEAMALSRELVAANSTNASTHQQYGEIMARARLWTDATNGLWRALDLQPNQMPTYRMLAPALIMIGDEDGYRRMCERMLAQFANTKDAGIAENTAKACLLLPRSGVDSNAVARMAEKSFQLGGNSEFRPWYELIMALAAYRHGKFMEATNLASQALIPQDAIPERQAITYLLLGLAQTASGEREAGRLSLEKAADITSRKLKKFGEPDFGVYWVDRIVVELLSREAHALMQPGSTQTPDTSKQNR